MIVKVYLKRQPPIELEEYFKTLTMLQKNLNSIQNSNVIPFQYFCETDKAAYLIRQYFSHNLLDRLSTRPFLSMIEKKWIAFQLLMALEQAHFQGVCHGDLKCENVMVTSWKWIYLTDFAIYKPTYIPEDDPSDFYFFFDSSATGTCSIAPERIVNLKKFKVGQIEPLPSMDIFSLGCLLAELFLEMPLFDFPSLLRYRSGDDDPLDPVFRIPNQDVRNLILHMLNRDPSKRYSASQYLIEWETRGFPKPFLVLHGYISRLMTMPPDRIIRETNNDRSLLTHYFVSPSKESNDPSPSFPLHLSLEGEEQSGMFCGGERADASSETPVLKAKLERYADSLVSDDTLTFHELEKIIQNKKTDINTNNFNQFTSSSDSKMVASPQNSHTNQEKRCNETIVDETDGASLFSIEKENTQSSAPIEPEGRANKPFLLDSSVLCNKNRASTDGTENEPDLVHSLKGDQKLMPHQLEHTDEPKEPKETQPLLVLILVLVCSQIRSIRSSFLRRTALDILMHFVPYTDDEFRLLHLLPYSITMFSDSDPLVRIAALRTLTRVVEWVKAFPPSVEAEVYPEYLLSSLSYLAHDKVELVRCELAAHLAKLAEIARSFLEKNRVLESDRLSKDQQKFAFSQKLQNYDGELAILQNLFLNIVTRLISTETSSFVKQSLLKDITRLCVFFGRATTNNFILPALITFLNDSDWRLKSCFFQHISGVALFVGTKSFERYFIFTFFVFFSI